METKVFERRYYGTKKNAHGNDVTKLWVSRVRENGVTKWRGGVLFESRMNGFVRSVVHDGVSWVTTLDEAPRASKKRDKHAIETLYFNAMTDKGTREAIDGMLALESVNADYLNGVWN